MTTPTIEPVGVTLTIGSFAPCAVTISVPGMDAGEMIDVTTLCNTAVKTKQFQSLIEITDMSFTRHFQLDEHDDWYALIGINSECVLTIPDHGTLTFWGGIRTYSVAEAGVGASMIGSGTIAVTNLNAADVETVPVFAAV